MTRFLIFLIFCWSAYLSLLPIGWARLLATCSMLAAGVLWWTETNRARRRRPRMVVPAPRRVPDGVVISGGVPGHAGVCAAPFDRGVVGDPVHCVRWAGHAGPHQAGFGASPVMWP